jgi:hypothetical protein
MADVCGSAVSLGGLARRSRSAVSLATRRAVGSPAHPRADQSGCGGRGRLGGEPRQPRHPRPSARQDRARTGALQAPAPTTDRFPTLEWQGPLALESLEPGWPMQRYTLREIGVVVSGPDPRSLLSCVPPDELRLASGGIVEEWRRRA